MDEVGSSETSMDFYQARSITSQKTVFFIFYMGEHHVEKELLVENLTCADVEFSWRPDFFSLTLCLPMSF
jgi:hypothetical protein